MNRFHLLLFASVLSSGCAVTPVKRYATAGTLGAELEGEFEQNANSCLLPKDPSSTSIPALVRSDFSKQLEQQAVKKVESTRLEALFAYAFPEPAVAGMDEARISPERMLQYNAESGLVLDADSNFDSLLYRFSCAHAAQARLDANAKLGENAISQAISADEKANSRFALFGGTYTSPLYLALKGKSVNAKRQALLFLWSKYAAHPDIYDPADGGKSPNYITGMSGWTTAKLTESSQAVKANARGAFSAGVAVTVSGQAQAEGSLESYFRLSKANIFVDVNAAGKEQAKFASLPSVAEIVDEFKKVKLSGNPVADRAFASTTTASSYRYSTAAVPEAFCNPDYWTATFTQANPLFARLELDVLHEKTECAFYLDYTVNAPALQSPSVPAKVTLTFVSPVRSAQLQMNLEEDVLTTHEPELSSPSNPIPSYRLETNGPVQYVNYSVDLVVRDTNARIDRTEGANHSISGLVVDCGEVKHTLESPQLQRPPASNGGLLRVEASMKVPFGKTAQQQNEVLCTLRGKVDLRMEKLPGRPPRFEKRDLVVSVRFPSIQ
jgi:hypothetical protein